MERRNKGRSKKRIEESSFVKAAAWAWYQHGSSHENQQMMQDYTDVSLRKTKKEARPSRYKLEAMKQQVQEKSDQVSHLSCLVHVHQDHDDDPKSLLDSYEIDRISKDLGCYIEGTHAKNCQNLCCPYKKLSSGSVTRSISHVGSKTDSFDVYGKKRGKSLSQGGANNGTAIEMKMKPKDRKSAKGFGFIVRRSSTMICGARLDDVADVRVKNGGSRWPENHVAVVNVSSCRPHRI